MRLNAIDTDLLKIISTAVKEMSEGELLQIEKAKKLDINVDTYFKIIKKKTASLISSCCALGASSVNATKDEIRLISEFGELIGIAFQIKDDLLDYECNNTKIGKPKLKDFKEGKITLPLFYALQSNAGKRNFLLSKLGKKISKKDEREVSKYILSGESLLVTKKTMHGYISLAAKNIARLKTHPSYDEMLELLEFIQGREK